MMCIMNGMHEWQFVLINSLRGTFKKHDLRSYRVKKKSCVIALPPIVYTFDSNSPVSFRLSWKNLNALFSVTHSSNHSAAMYKPRVWTGVRNAPLLTPVTGGNTSTRSSFLDDPKWTLALNIGCFLLGQTFIQFHVHAYLFFFLPFFPVCSFLAVYVIDHVCFLCSYFLLRLLLLPYLFSTIYFSTMFIFYHVLLHHFLFSTMLISFHIFLCHFYFLPCRHSSIYLSTIFIFYHVYFRPCL